VLLDQPAVEPAQVNTDAARSVSPTSPLELLDRSFAAVEALIDNIRPQQLSAPTACTEWTVREVVRHLIGMNLVFAAMLAAEPPPRRGDDVADADLSQEYRDSAVRLLAVFSRPGVLDQIFQGPLGNASGSDRLKIRLYDLLAHGWDIARATEQPVALPEDAAELALDFVQHQLSDVARSGRFGPAQFAPPDAPAIGQLVAYLGRSLT
jgi:uncharacterized protein (TIGR03086 family)